VYIFGGSCRVERRNDGSAISSDDAQQVPTERFCHDQITGAVERQRRHGRCLQPDVRRRRQRDGGMAVSDSSLYGIIICRRWTRATRCQSRILL